MKNSDVALIILIAAISVVVSYLLGNMLLGDPNERVESISYMTPIGSSIDQPDIETFNPYAHNPTVEVYIGNCGPLEVWSESRHVCIPREGFRDEDEDDSEDTDDVDTSDDSNTSGDE